MASFKFSRTAEDVKRELTDIFRTLKDPRINGMLTILKVDLSTDLSYCKVYVRFDGRLSGSKKCCKGT